MILLVHAALAVPFGGLTAHGTLPLLEVDYTAPGAIVGAYGGATFPNMGFDARVLWGTGEGDFAYRLFSGRVDGLHLFRPEDRLDPFVLYGVGFRSTIFPDEDERRKALRLGVKGTPAVVAFGEVGGGVIVGVAGPLHVRVDGRAWLGLGVLRGGDRPFAGFDASLGLELRPVKRDRDRDGYLDPDDACPTEPEDFDELQDFDGCPEEDLDGDRIADVRDRCPTRRETPNGLDDIDGCPDLLPAAVEALPPPLRAFTGTIDGIVFALDSAEILPASEPVLAAAVGVLHDYPDVEVAILGHTDATADDAYNLALSEARAEAVAAWLVAHGIDAARLTADGLGETAPIDTNDTEEGRARNRRVEFVIVR